MDMGDQIVDAIQGHRRVSRQQARERAAEMFKLVGIEPRRLSSYPHDLSGVMRLFTAPKHPYTAGLMNSFPSISGEKRKVQGIPGTPQDLVVPPPGCRFAPRCPYVMDICRRATPPLYQPRAGHRVRCYLYDDAVIAARQAETGIASTAART